MFSSLAMWDETNVYMYKRSFTMGISRDKYTVDKLTAVDYSLCDPRIIYWVIDQLMSVVQRENGLFGFRNAFCWICICWSRIIIILYQISLYFIRLIRVLS